METIRVNAVVEMGGETARVEINAPASAITIADEPAFDLLKSSSWKRSNPGAVFLVGYTNAGRRFRSGWYNKISHRAPGLRVENGIFRSSFPPIRTNDPEVFVGCLDQDNSSWSVTPETAARKLQERPAADVGFNRITIHRRNGKKECWTRRPAELDRTEAHWRRTEGADRNTSAELAARIANARTIASVEIKP